MPDANELHSRALLAATMAERCGLSEVGEALLQAAERLPRRVAGPAKSIAETRSHC